MWTLHRLDHKTASVGNWTKNQLLWMHHCFSKRQYLLHSKWAWSSTVISSEYCASNALKADVVAGIRSCRDSCHGLLIMFSSIFQFHLAGRMKLSIRRTGTLSSPSPNISPSRVASRGSILIAPLKTAPLLTSTLSTSSIVSGSASDT